ACCAAVRLVWLPLPSDPPIRLPGRECYARCRTIRTEPRTIPPAWLRKNGAAVRGRCSAWPRRSCTSFRFRFRFRSSVERGRDFLLIFPGLGDGFVFFQGEEFAVAHDDVAGDYHGLDVAALEGI